MRNVIIIEDDIEIANGLKLYLEKNNYQVRVFHHPLEGLEALAKDSFDIVLLDLMLPEIDGLEVCKRIREGDNIPIIMLTAKDDLTDKVVGLELGADDYIPKPFEPRELLARMSAVLRRTQEREKKKTHDIATFFSFTLNSAERTLKQENQTIELTTHEFDLLEVLVEANGKVLSRDEIMNLLHGVDRDFFSRSIDVNISRLRQKIESDPKNPKIIKTIWGKGYQLVKGEE